MSTSKKTTTKASSHRQPASLMAKIDSWLDRHWLVVLATASIFLMLATVAVYYPGHYNEDSMSQLCQAVGKCPYESWHPLSLTLIWQVLIKLTGQPVALFLVQIVVFYLALFLLSIFVYKRSHSRILSLSILAIGLLPNVINRVGFVEKGIQIAVFSLLSFSLLLVSKHWARPLKVIINVVCILLLGYAASLRTGTVVLLIPLLVMWLDSSKEIFGKFDKLKLWLGRTIFCISLTILIVVMSLMPSFPSKIIKGLGYSMNERSATVSMYALDLANLYNIDELNDLDIMDPDIKDYLTNLLQSDCSYNSGSISTVRVSSCGETYLLQYISSPDKLPELKSIWLDAVLKKPFKYVAYKIDTYLSFLFPDGDNMITYITTDLHWDNFNKEDYVKDPSKITFNIIRKYTHNFGYRYFPFLYAGWFWLMVSLALIIYAVKRKLQNRPYIIILASSALLNILSYSVGSLTNDYRYIYWSVLACLVAIIMLVVEEMTRRESSIDSVLAENNSDSS